MIRVRSTCAGVRSCLLVVAVALCNIGFIGGCGTTCPQGQALVNGQCVDSSTEGGCCFGGSCTFGDAGFCAASNGQFNPGKNCGEISCNGGGSDTQACCDGADCTDRTIDECIASGGTPEGEGTTCADTLCLRR